LLASPHPEWNDRRRNQKPMLVTCPHCKTDLAATPELFGQTVQCPACNGRLQMPDGETKTETSKRSRPQRAGWEERDHANVHFAKSLIIGVLLTACVLGLMLPIADTGIGAIFLKRGWVNFAETFLFVWGMTILVMKWKQNQHQARAAMLELFPPRLGQEINCDNVGSFIDNVYKIPVSLRDSLIVNRIRKALELFESRTDNGEVASFLSTQSDIDANRSSGSYSLLKVFLWAIPILGFIGTVMGLSVAVGSLAMGDNADPEALKSSINSLTGGLGVAFDTTLLGLILSMLMSFPMAAVQKKEDETLTLIDAFCTEKLLPKLNDSRNATSDRLLEQAHSIPQLVASLARAHETFLVNLNDSTRMLCDASENMEKRLIAHQEAVDKAFTDAVMKLSDKGTEVFARSNTELVKTFENMATGIDLINDALRDLGQNKIPDSAKRKRGFFGK
jgi:flagellar motor component MotA